MDQPLNEPPSAGARSDGIERASEFAAFGKRLALVVGGYVLRKGTFSGRSMLAARLTVALAMLAKEEQLILPPARVTAGQSGEGPS